MDTEIKLQFTPDRKDYIRASRALAKKTPAFLILAGVILVVIIASMVVLAFPSIGDAGWRGAATLTLVGGLLYVLYYLVVIPYQLSRAYKTRESLRMERCFVFTDQNVRMQIGDQIVELQWKNFQKVIDGGEFYLMLHEDEERVYPFVPTHAFDSPAAEDSFLQLLDEKSIPVI